MKYKILLVDDENDILEFLSYNLEKENYSVITATNGIDALKKLNQNPDLIVLDVMMPKLDGYETCKRIRELEKFKYTPIIFLTAKSNENDEITGLDVGADDFIRKPVSQSKLIARIKANLRKIEKQSVNQTELKYYGIQINIEKHQTVIDGKEIFFPKKEFELLKLFLMNPGKILTRKFILKEIWGDEIFVVDRTIDVHIRKIREKLNKYEYFIQTIKGVGYKLIDETEIEEYQQ